MTTVSPGVDGTWRAAAVEAEAARRVAPELALGSAGRGRRLLGRRVGSGLSLLVIALVLICSVLPSLLAIHGPTSIDLGAVLQGPTWAHPLGTDEFGRDIAGRIVYGARPVLLTGLLATAIAAIGGAVIGTTCGFLGGGVDLLFMRAVDVVMVFPSLLLALTFITAFGSSAEVVTVAIGIALLPYFARVMRSEVLRVRQEGYVDAAGWIGVSRLRTAVTHILPNVLPSLLVLSTFAVGSAILISAALSFLGVGVSGTTPDWGLMLANGEEYISVAWWDVVMPGLAISILVLSINVLGDRVRDSLDPRAAATLQSARRGVLVGSLGRRR